MFEDTCYIIKKTESWSTNFNGILGMNPFVVDVYYLSKGYQVSYYEKIDAAPKDHDVYILLYLYPDRATSKLTAGFIIRLVRITLPLKIRMVNSLLITIVKKPD